MLVGVAVGFELARELRRTDPNPTERRPEHGSIRFLGHAAFALEHDGTTVLIDPFLTGNPKAAVDAPTRSSADAILLTHGHADHFGDTVASPSAPARPSSRSSSWPARSPGSGVETSRPQHRRHGRRSTGAGSARARLAHVHVARSGTSHTPGRHRRRLGGKRSTTSATRRCSATSRCRPSAAHDRRRARPDRRPLHDGPLRRRRSRPS